MKFFGRFFMPALLSMCFIPIAAHGELPTEAPDEVGMSVKKLDLIEPAMQKALDQHAAAGIITIVARHGKVVYFNTFGFQDIEAKTPMRADTIFRIYSMSKPITSVALMMLYEQGKVDLDDPVTKYIPQFKDLKVFESESAEGLQLSDPDRPMAVLDLLRHTSGLTYGRTGVEALDALYKENQVRNRDADLGQMAKALGSVPLRHHPGTVWHYGYSTDVCGYLVEVISGQTLDVFFEQHIFQPLGMTDTAFYVPAEKLDRFATNYGPLRENADEDEGDDDGNDDGENQGEIIGLRAIDTPATSRYRNKPTWRSGGGGLVSTAHDYMRFCLMLAHDGELDGRRLLKAETIQMMRQNQLPAGVWREEKEGQGFGLGFAVQTKAGETKADGRIDEHGWGGAASTRFWLSPRDGLITISLTQYMPFSSRVPDLLKPLVYEALTDE